MVSGESALLDGGLLARLLTGLAKLTTKRITETITHNVLIFEADVSTQGQR